MFGGGEFAASAGVDTFGFGFFPDLLLEGLLFFPLGLLLLLEGRGAAELDGQLLKVSEGFRPLLGLVVHLRPLVVGVDPPLLGVDEIRYDFVEGFGF